MTLSFSCKNEKTNKKEVISEVKKVEAVAEEKKESMEEEEWATTDNKYAPIKKDTVDKAEKENEKKQTAGNKSEPKPEPVKEIKTETVEKVGKETEEVKSNTTDESDRLPKPEPEEKTEVVEQVDPGEPIVEVINEPAPLHEPFNDLLVKYVSQNGNVNYKGLKTVSKKLNTYLNALSETSVSSLNRSEQLAFWINAYNANTLKLIIENYPVSKITDLDGGKPWDRKWIKIDGKTLSLNNIENDIIRPQFNEPRIHFAVNCAAKSCPPLLNKAWTAENLEGNLKRQTKNFINNAEYNTISKNEIEVSKIFDWYAEDFGDLIAFINNYSSTKVKPSAQITFKEYNWNLNN